MEFLPRDPVHRRAEISGCVPVTLDRPRILKFTLASMAAYEDQVKQSGNSNTRRLQLMAWVMLINEDPALDLRTVGRIIEPPMVQPLAEAVKECLRICTISTGKKSDIQINWWDLWAHGRIDLGLDDKEFWDLTPVMLHHLTQHESRSRLTGNAMICALLANIHRDHKKKPDAYTIADFLPGQSKADAQPTSLEARRKAAMALQAKTEMMMRQLGGLTAAPAKQPGKGKVAPKRGGAK